MKRISAIILSLFIFLLLTACTESSASDFHAFPLKQHITVSPGEKSSITIRVEIPQNYHIYGNPKGPGTGRATELKPERYDRSAFKFTSARFMQPEKLIAPGGYVNIYNKQTDIILPFQVLPHAEPSAQNIDLSLAALLCGEGSCEPKQLSLHISMEIVPRGSKASPRSSDALLQNFKNVSSADTTAETKAEPFSDQIADFTPKFFQKSVSGLLQAVIFGLIAGFILNFMPCVLPVVSLKIMGFVKNANQDRKILLRLGFLFSAGIMTAFCLLAVLAAFFGYSWGALFQSTLFLRLMTALIFILSLSLFGIFTLRPPSFRSNADNHLSIYADSFIKGLLATVLATPCSGPFLGATLAWSLTMPPPVIFVVFISVGAGMALPYIFLAAFPSMLARIPKPGRWMITFEQIMGFLMIFTVVYLLSILPSEMLMPMLTFLAVCAVAFWQYGRFGSIDNKRIKRIVSAAALLAIVAGGYELSFSVLYINTPNVETKMQKAEFSYAKLEENSRKSRISMVEFTADWCPNCRLVEASALHSEEVLSAVKENDVDFMVADITEKSPTAEALLKKLGSRSIPFLAVFPSGKNFHSPICLRDIYSSDDVISAIKQAVQLKSAQQYMFEIKTNE